MKLVKWMKFPSLLSKIVTLLIFIALLIISFLIGGIVQLKKLNSDKLTTSLPSAIYYNMGRFNLRLPSDKYKFYHTQKYVGGSYNELNQVSYTPVILDCDNYLPTSKASIYQLWLTPKSGTDYEFDSVYAWDTNHLYFPDNTTRLKYSWIANSVDELLKFQDPNTLMTTVFDPKYDSRGMTIHSFPNPNPWRISMCTDDANEYPIYIKNLNYPNYEKVIYVETITEAYGSIFNLKRTLLVNKTVEDDSYWLSFSSPDFTYQTDVSDFCNTKEDPTSQELRDCVKQYVTGLNLDHSKITSWIDMIIGYIE